MNWPALRAILALPFNALVVVPILLCWWTGSWRPSRPDEATFGLGLLCLAAGLALMSLTIRDFARRGQGTLAPWDPPRKLVVNGVYRHVRNPMMTGVFLNLLGESLLFRAPPIAAWLALFVLVNAFYLPLMEEPGLEKRFGEDYRRYKEAVPRWIPRLRPWRG